MNLWEFNKVIETHIPWWVPFVLGIVLVIVFWFRDMFKGE